jgi:hypothetical protein
MKILAAAIVIFLTFKAQAQEHAVYAEFVDTVEARYDYNPIVHQGQIKYKRDSVGLDTVILIKLYTLAEGKKEYLPLELKRIINRKPQSFFIEPKGDLILDWDKY